MLLQLRITGIVLLFATLSVYGQDEVYARHDQVNIPMRWWLKLQHEPATVHFGSLVLTADHRFEYYTSGCLPYREYGSWERTDNRLILKIDSTDYGNPDKKHIFIVKGKKLYHANEKKWALKKR